MEPKTGDWEDDSPFQKGDCQVLCQFVGTVLLENCRLMDCFYTLLLEPSLTSSTFLDKTHETI